MPHQPVYKEFGIPLSEGSKTSSEVFDAEYGKYKETGSWDKDGSRENPAAKLDPKPFGNLK